MNNMQYQQRLLAKHSGFGLLELMIAMVIGLILMAGVIELYIGNKAAYRTSEAMSRLQENARFAMYQLQKDIRMAGYGDCAPNIVNHLNPAGNGYDDTLFDLRQAVGGWEFTASGGTGPGDTYTITDLSPSGVALSSWVDQDGSNLPASLQNLIVPGTDLITMKTLGSPDSISVRDNNQITSRQIGTNGASGIEQYAIVLVTQDCVGADLFQKRNNSTATSVSQGAGSQTNPGPGNVNPNTLFSGAKKWTQEYGPGARFIEFESRTYFIGMDASNIPSLYRVSFNTGSAGTPEKLVEGVESMQVLYGEDTDSPEDGTANIYRTINTVADGEKVSSVRISLLMRTIEAVAAEDDTKADYKLAGHSAASATQINPINDRFLRYVFTSTIKIRNRGSL